MLEFATPAVPGLRTIRRNRRSEGGYVLLTLMLFVALLAIAAAAVAPTVAFQIQRDREEELIHRGVQYSRAVRRYFKKFGRYPNRIEELENTNNLRFLRQRYKDPVTGGDFKILRMGQVRLNFGPGIAGATPAGVNPAAMAGALAGGRRIGLVGTAGTMSQSAAGIQQMGQTNVPGTGLLSSAQADQGDSESNPSSQVFGGGPIVGVVSTSKAESIREFNKKNHYDEWQFIYDPRLDRGGLLNTPAQPQLQLARPNQPGTPGGMGGMQGQPEPQNPPANQPPQ